MNPLRKIVWLVTLLAFTAGCSSYRALPPRTAGEAPVETPEALYDVDTGDDVRIETVGGARVQGQVLQADPAGITMSVKKQAGLSPAVPKGKPCTVASADILKLEKRRFDAGNTVVLLILIAAPIVAMAATWEPIDFSMDSGNWGTLP